MFEIVQNDIEQRAQCGQEVSWWGVSGSLRDLWGSCVELMRSWGSNRPVWQDKGGPGEGWYGLQWGLGGRRPCEAGSLSDREQAPPNWKNPDREFYQQLQMQEGEPPSECESQRKPEDKHEVSGPFYYVSPALPAWSYQTSSCRLHIILGERNWEVETVWEIKYIYLEYT